MTELGILLGELEKASTADHRLPPVLTEPVDNQLVMVRLGMASSLFTALRYRHPATAGHALRCALTCSAWAQQMGLPSRQHDVIELAALLHDVGIVGIPDHIMLKPGAHDASEAAIMAQAREMSLDILRQSCASAEILEVVEHVPAWYDGSRTTCRFSGEQIPLGARMIAIAEAFDAMITDRVYRPALSSERAMTELFHCAGTQFDPELVKQFIEFQQHNPTQRQRDAAGRWLQVLDCEMANNCWQLTTTPPRRNHPSAESLFQAKLLENMYDAVVFIDAAGRIALWNRGAERLTGITASSICQTLWQPGLLHLRDEMGRNIAPADCPVSSVIRSGVQSLRRLTMFGRSGQCVEVDTHAIPVLGPEGSMLGAILLFHDASSITSLERQCQSLHEKATKDPLTQVANRAEFDRVHELFVAAHQQQRVPCSLIIGDLDHFKEVNDTYGHQAGDAIIKSLANLLKSACRPGDLVARYGGEEFVVLCADCDNIASARRADEIRAALAQLAQPSMNGRNVTVSFGVTEIQPGDTPETMLRRADRALFMAKAKGRNTVVQLGSGSARESTDAPTGFWHRRKPRTDQLLERTLMTPVPIKMTVEKLRGFVADHLAKIVLTDGNHVQLELSDQSRSRFRRLTDRSGIFCVDLRFEEDRSNRNGNESAINTVVHTRIHVCISPKSDRDRRRDDVGNRARELLVSIRSYLMATEIDSPPPTGGALNRAKRILTPWRGKK